MATLLRSPAARALAGAPASTRAFSATAAPQATLRELESRIKSVKNIGKITKSMKMIATSRLTKSQQAMERAKAYGAANGQVFTEALESKDDKSGEKAAAADPKKTLWVVVSGDRGMCGGIHSSVSKRARRELAEHPEGKLIVLGDKPKAQISRAMPENVLLSVNQIGKGVPTFAEALAITEKIEEVAGDFDKINVIYNKYISVIAYESAILEVYNSETLKAAPGFQAYELEDEALISDLTAFSTANAVYSALVEGFAAEIAARRQAMDNASKNSDEMGGKLQMTFNRMRQAQITNDLVDIITGANAI